MRVENSSLLKQLTDISQKYNESAVDNRVLKADVETLRAKVIYSLFMLFKLRAFLTARLGRPLHCETEYLKGKH